MNIYYFLGAILGALIFYLDNRFSQKKKTNWGIIPFISIVWGAWVYISPQKGDYLDIIYYAVILIVAFLIIKFVRRLSNSAYAHYQKLQNEGDTKFSASIKSIYMFLLAGSLMLGFFIDIRIFFLAFVLTIVFYLLENTPEKRFLKYQKNLATSKIRSIAMGLAEIEGKITAGTQLRSQLGGKSCYGSFYSEYAISKNKEGKKSYRLIKSKNVIHDFTLTDDTGSIKVVCDPEHFVFAGLQPHSDFESGSIRYKEYIIEGNKSYLLIGTVDSDNGTPIITRKPPHHLLGLSPSAYVTRWNKTGPFRRNLVITISIALILVAFVFITPMEYHNGLLTLHFNQISFLGGK